MSEKRINNVAIIGCGVIGSTVAWACAVNGLGTYLYDVSEERIERSRQKLENWFFDGRLTEAEAKKALANVHPSPDLKETLSKVDLALFLVPLIALRGDTYPPHRLLNEPTQPEPQPPRLAC